MFKRDDSSPMKLINDTKHILRNKSYIEKDLNSKISAYAKQIQSLEKTIESQSIQLMDQKEKTQNLESTANVVKTELSQQINNEMKQKDKIKSLKTEKSQLNDQISKQNISLTHLNNTANESFVQYNNQQETINELKTTINNLKDELNQVNKQNHYLTKDAQQYASFKEKIPELEDENTLLKSKIEILKSRNKEHEQLMQCSEAQVQILQKKMQDLDNNIHQELKQQNQILRYELNDNINAQEGLNSQIEELKLEIIDFKSNQLFQKEKDEILFDKFENEENKNIELSEKLATVQSKLKIVISDNQNLNRTLELMIDNAESQENQITSYQNNIRDLTAESLVYRTEIKNLKENKDSAKLLEEVENWRYRYQNAFKAMNNTQDKLGIIMQEKRQFETQLTISNATIDKLNKEKNDLEESLKRCESKLKIENLKNSNLEELNDVGSSKKTDQNTQIEELKEMNKLLNQDLVKLREEITNLRNLKQTQSNDINELKEIIIMKDNQINNLEAKNIELDSRLKTKTLEIESQSKSIDKIKSELIKVKEVTYSYQNQINYENNQINIINDFNNQDDSDNSKKTNIDYKDDNINSKQIKMHYYEDKLIDKDAKIIELESKLFEKEIEIEGAKLSQDEMKRRESQKELEDLITSTTFEKQGIFELNLPPKDHKLSTIQSEHSQEDSNDEQNVVQEGWNLFIDSIYKAYQQLNTYFQSDKNEFHLQTIDDLIIQDFVQDKVIQQKFNVLHLMKEFVEYCERMNHIQMKIYDTNIKYSIKYKDFESSNIKKIEEEIMTLRIDLILKETFVGSIEKEFKSNKDYINNFIDEILRLISEQSTISTK